MLIDFMVIGAQKCGTSSLAKQLAVHPEICFCKIKEPGYFHKTDDWEAGLEEYHSLYAPAAGQICGESSTMYTFLPEWRGTHERLFAYNPELKLIYIMRQPVERVISNYAHRVVRRTVEGPPEVAIFANPTYINRTRYGVQLRPYLELFGRDKILPIIFEEYIADQTRTLGQIAEFLDISRDGFPTDHKEVVVHKTAGSWYLPPSLNKLTYSDTIKTMMDYIPSPLRRAARRLIGKRIDEKPEFSPVLRETIWRLLEDDVGTVEGLLGRRLDVWRDGYTQ